MLSGHSNLSKPVAFAFLHKFICEEGRAVIPPSKSDRRAVNVGSTRSSKHFACERTQVRQRRDSRGTRRGEREGGGARGFAAGKSERRRSSKGRYRMVGRTSLEATAQNDDLAEKPECHIPTCLVSKQAIQVLLSTQITSFHHHQKSSKSSIAIMSPSSSEQGGAL